MALDPTGLKTSLVDVFNAPTSTFAAAAVAWSDALKAYALGLIPATTSHDAAATALATDLEDAFGSEPPPADEEEAAENIGETLVTWAAALGLGQPPAFTYVVPLAADIATLKADLTTAFVAGRIPSTSVDDTAGAIRDAVQTWMTAQESVPASPPPPTVPWS